MNADSATLICLACYKDRLASVCENADEYKLFEIRDNKIYPAGHLSLPSKDPMDRTSAILACGVASLLCGAVCNRTRSQLQNNGITVVPWLTGTVDDALKNFMNNTLSTMLMPGCHRNGRRTEGRQRQRMRQRRKPGHPGLSPPPDTAI